MIYIIVRPRPPRIDPKSRVGNGMDRIPNPDHAHPRPHRINPMNRFPRQSSPASRNDIYQTFFALKTRASPVFSYPAAGGVGGARGHTQCDLSGGYMDPIQSHSQGTGGIALPNGIPHDAWHTSCYVSPCCIAHWQLGALGIWRESHV